MERTQLSMVRQVRFARRRSGDKSEDQPIFGRHNRPWLERIRIREIIPLCPIFGTKLIEVVVGKQRPVGRLP